MLILHNELIQILKVYSKFKNNCNFMQILLKTYIFKGIFENEINETAFIHPETWPCI